MNEHVDPFEALRAPVVPVDPDPGFAAGLRRRLERALLDPRGVTMTNTETNTPTVPVHDGDVGFASIWVPDQAKAAEFYAAVLGWEFDPEGRRVTNSRHHQGVFGGNEHPTTFLAHAVTDLDAVLARVRAAGGTAGEPEQHPWGPTVDCVDDQGLAFAVYQADTRPDLDQGSAQGDLVYLTYAVPDTARFRAFHEAVFGWTFTPGRVDDGWGIEGINPIGGVHGGVDVPRMAPMYRVTDVAAAVERVRAAGGDATDPAQMPYGLTSDCHDDQGSFFYLGQL
jgi:predicted enzyme related to lactoylglutathione lyase